MKNFIQPGHTVTVPAFPYQRNSGQGVKVGAALFGIAVNTTANGAEGEIKTTGVFEVDKTNAQAWVVGDKIYWDDVAKLFTNVDGNAGADILVGVALKAAANPSGKGIVKLTGLPV